MYKKVNKDKLDFWHKFLGIISSIIKIGGFILAVIAVYKGGDLLIDKGTAISEVDAQEAKSAPVIEKLDEIGSHGVENIEPTQVAQVKEVKLLPEKKLTHPSPVNNSPSWLSEDMYQADAWRVKMKIDCLHKGRSCGQVEFRELNCAGTLTYIGQKYGNFVFEEHIEYGSCVKGCELHLAENGYSYKEFCKGRYEGGGQLSY